MLTHAARRHKLLANGYASLPVEGKRPPLEDWQKTDANKVELWEKLCAHATNTGILTHLTPTFDIDFVNPDAEQSRGLFTPQPEVVAALSALDMNTRERLPNRRASEVFDLEVGGLTYTASLARFGNGKISELFLNNHKSNSSADTNARDNAIAFSFAVQHGADAEDIRCALSRDAQGRAPGPLGVALDIIAGGIRR